MRKIFLTISIVVSILVGASFLNFSFANTDDHTAKEEAEGKVVWQKLQAKQVTCSQLTDNDFGVLGEYFMGQMMGDAHESMNNMMVKMMDEEGEEEMHVVMGKRMSGCDANAQGSQSMMGMMMRGMQGGEGGMMGQGTGMMGYGPMMNWGQMGGSNWGWIGTLGLVFWIILLIDLVLLGMWLGKEITKK